MLRAKPNVTFKINHPLILLVILFLACRDVTLSTYCACLIDLRCMYMSLIISADLNVAHCVYMRG